MNKEERKANFLARIRAAANLLEFHHIDRDLNELSEFIDAFNPYYPMDSVSLKTAMVRVLNRSGFPGIAEKDNLDTILAKSDFHRGEGRWKLTTEGLSYHYTAKRWDRHYRIDFGELTYPLTVTVTRYADMDNLDNHSELCPMRLDEDNPDWSDDCDCSPTIDMIFRDEFIDRTAMNHPDRGLAAFLCHAYWSEKPWHF